MFPNSTILTQDLSIQLSKLISLASNQSYPLKYRASRNGFKSSDFNSIVWYTRNTLTIVKTHKGFIFGVYKSEKWLSGKEDPYAFMFSLVNSYNKTEKLNLIK